MNYMFDLRCGIFDMETKYSGVTTFRNAGGTTLFADQATLELDETATTISVALRNEMLIRGVLVRPSIGFKYYSDVAVIDHPQTDFAPITPVSLSTDSATMYTAGLELAY